MRPLAVRPLLGIGLMFGCGEGATSEDPAFTGPCDVPAAAAEPGIELGSGLQDFVPVDDGDEIEIVFGPQGGYHLDGSLRVWGVEAGNADDLSDPDNPLTTFRVLRESGEPVSGVPGDDLIDYRQGLEPTCAEGVYEMVGRRIFLDASDAELRNETLTVVVTVEDVDGVQVEDTHELVAVPSPFN